MSLDTDPMITPLHSETSDPWQSQQLELPHVLLVLDQLTTTLGGGERIVLRLASLLPQWGFRPSILTFSADPKCTALVSPPCPIFQLPLKRTYDLTALRAAIDLKRFLRQHDVKIVQTFFESSDLWGGFVTKTLSDAKLIWSRRDMGILRAPKHESAYRMMGGFPDAVLAVSEQVRQHCIQVDHINPEHVHTVHNGLDLADWKPTCTVKHAGGFVIATVGNIRRVKGYDVLLHAAARVITQFPDVLFTIAGDVLEPDYFAELQTMVRDLGLSEHVYFPGGVVNLNDFLSPADIFVLPSRSEGFSNAIIEAMASSLPVVATNVGGNSEAVKDGVNGFVVPSDNAIALADAILRLLRDSSMRNNMGAAGRNIVSEHFTTDVMMKKTTDIYAHLLS